MDYLESYFVKSNIFYFESFGGDTEILFLKCKTAHSSCLFIDDNVTKMKKILTDLDLKNGLNMFLSDKKKNIHQRKNKSET